MTPSNPWLRFFAGLLAAAIAIRLAIDIVRPVLGYLLAALVLLGVVLLVRWWRHDRW